MILTIPFPNIDPTLIEFGPLAIRWYSLAYIAGLVIGWRYCRRLALRPPPRLAPDDFDDLAPFCGGKEKLASMLANPVTGDNPGYEYIKPTGGANLNGTVMIYQLRSGQRDLNLPVARADGSVGALNTSRLRQNLPRQVAKRVQPRPTRPKNAIPTPGKVVRPPRPAAKAKPTPPAAARTNPRYSVACSKY